MGEEEGGHGGVGLNPPPRPAQAAQDSVASAYAACYSGVLRAWPDAASYLSHLRAEAAFPDVSLIFAVDCSKSNLASGARTFAGRSLHDMSGQSGPNPYQFIMSLCVRVLGSLDEDGRIPLLGFGDRKTTDMYVFNFKADGGSCEGIEDVLATYAAVMPTLELSGPTSFAPTIHKALEYVKAGGNDSLFLLVIITDGAVTARRETVAAIVEASKHPLAIVAVGVGDGPWGEMITFDDGACAPLHPRVSADLSRSSPSFRDPRAQGGQLQLRGARAPRGARARERHGGGRCVLPRRPGRAVDYHLGDAQGVRASTQGCGRWSAGLAGKIRPRRAAGGAQSKVIPTPTERRGCAQGAGGPPPTLSTRGPAPSLLLRRRLLGRGLLGRRLLLGCRLLGRRLLGRRLLRLNKGENGVEFFAKNS